MILSAFIGALVVLVPSIICCVITTQAKEQAQDLATEAWDELTLRQSQWIYSLKNPKDAGQVIEEADLEAVEILSKQRLSNAMNDKNEIIGKRLICNLPKGSMLQENLLYQGAEITDDLRNVTISFANLPEGIVKGDWIDLRIFFPDGEDFVVLAKKYVEDVIRTEEGTESAIILRLSEEEILHLAGAYVDSKEFSDVSIYALCYVSPTQGSAVVNYPVNDAVYTLMGSDPNIINPVAGKGKSQARQLLEQNLGKGLSKEETSVTSDLNREELLDLFD